jgi:hypothetical protein
MALGTAFRRAYTKEQGVLVSGKRYQVFSVKERSEGERAVWVRAGAAFVNRDGSLNVYLDVLPLDGKLHVREALDKKDEAKPLAQLGEGAPAAEPMMAEAH